MKPKALTRMTAITVFAALAIPMVLKASALPKDRQHTFTIVQTANGTCLGTTCTVTAGTAPAAGPGRSPSG